MIENIENAIQRIKSKIDSLRPIFIVLIVNMYYPSHTSQKTKW